MEVSVLMFVGHYYKIYSVPEWRARPMSFTSFFSWWLCFILVPVLRREQRRNLFLLTGIHSHQSGCQVSTISIPLALYAILHNSLPLLSGLQNYCCIANNQHK
jgi:hypothetical protein